MTDRIMTDEQTCLLSCPLFSSAKSSLLQRYDELPVQRKRKTPETSHALLRKMRVVQ